MPDLQITITMSFELFILLACTPDYGIDHVEPELPQRQDIPTSDLPSLSGCEVSRQILPIDVDETTSGDETDNLFYGACPVGLTDTYAVSEEGFLKTCTDAADSRLDAIKQRAMSVFVDDFALTDLLACRVPFTAYAEFERDAIELVTDSDGIVESGQVWLTPDYAKDEISEEDFKANGITDEEGHSTTIFPRDYFYGQATHARPKVDDDDFDSSRERHATFYNTLAAAGKAPPEDESLSANYESDGEGNSETVLFSGDDRQSYAAPNADYTLISSAAYTAQAADGLLTGLAAICQIKADEMTDGLKRCAVYFSGEGD